MSYCFVSYRLEHDDTGDSPEWFVEKVIGHSILLLNLSISGYPEPHVHVYAIFSWSDVRVAITVVYDNNYTAWANLDHGRASTMHTY